MPETQPTALEFALPQELIGKRVGSYVILRKLGEGGMGVVYLAEHREVGQKAAVKVLHADVSRDELAARRFYEEARAVSLADHPGLVKLFDFNKLPDGRLYLLMEYVPGESLFQRLERLRGTAQNPAASTASEPRTPPLPTALLLVRQVASVLRHAHERGVIHRDIKPENILLTPDLDHPGQERARLLDFGIAKLRDGVRTHLTREGAVLGTPRYMAPEQVDIDRQVGPPADIYALGVTFYELCCGVVPFYKGTPEAIIYAHLRREPPPLRERAPHLPEIVTSLVHRMLAKEPAERPTASQVIEALDQLLGSASRSGAVAVHPALPEPAVEAPPPAAALPPPSDPPPASAPAAARHPRGVALGGAVLALCAVAALRWGSAPAPGPARLAAVDLSAAVDLAPPAALDSAPARPPDAAAVPAKPAPDAGSSRPPLKGAAPSRAPATTRQPPSHRPPEKRPDIPAIPDPID